MSQCCIVIMRIGEVNFNNFEILQGSIIISILWILYIFVMLRLQCILFCSHTRAEIWKIQAQISHGIMNIFCERMAGYLTSISANSNYDSWNSVFRFSSFRIYVTLRCLIKVVHIEMVMVIIELVISEVYLLYIFAYNFQRFWECTLTKLISL